MEMINQVEELIGDNIVYYTIPDAVRACFQTCSTTTGDNVCRPTLACADAKINLETIYCQLGADEDDAWP